MSTGVPVAYVDDDAPCVADLALLPAQLRANLPECSPEKLLWIAVVEDAVRCLASQRSELRDDAVEWFASAAEDFGSFRWLIYSLGFDADAWQDRIRRGIPHVKVNLRMKGPVR